MALILWSELPGSRAPSQFEVKGVAFNSTAADPRTATPKTIPADLRRISALEVHFRVKANDDHYDNLFQTADGPNAIRLELTYPRTLNLALSDKSNEHYFKASTEFVLGQWHDIRLKAVKDEFVDLVLDGKKILSIRDSRFTHLRYDVGLIGVGTGFSQKRPLQGEIEDFTFSASHVEWGSPADLLVLFLTIALAAGIFWHLYQDHAGARAFDSIKVRCDLIFLGVVLTALSMGWVLGQIETPYAKWYPIILAGLSPLLLPWLIGAPRGRVGKPLAFWLLQAAYVLGLLGLGYLILSAVPHPRSGTSIAALSIVLVSAFGTAILCVVRADAENPRAWIEHLGVLVLLSLGTWAALIELPNWHSLVDSLHHYPSATVFGLALCLAASWRFVLPTTASASKFLTRWKLRPRWGIFAEALVVYVTFFLLSFRSDSLFLGTSELHWEYYVGPVRALKSGFWLLWDVPSQYGLLNIAIPAILPARNSWQAFYLFQGCLLWIASSLAYLSLIRAGSSRVLAFLLVAAGIFFADPDLIGPSLYPSSSVVRFFWCYVLLFLLSNYAVNKESFSRSFAIPGLAAWFIGVLWAFESAVYCTVIYFSVLLAADALSAFNGERSTFADSAREFGKLALRRSLTAGGLLGAIGLVLWTLYKAILGVAPDVRMYLEHAFSYASGFGSLPLNASGAGWVFVIAFSGVASSVRLDGFRTSAAVVFRAGALGCILALATYYVGRATPSNVTAVLPIIALILALCLKLSAKDTTLSPGLAAIAVPIFVLLLASSVGSPRFVSALQGFDSFTTTIEQRLRKPDTSLADLLMKAHIKTSDRVVYYGFDAAMPVYERPDGKNEPYEKTWLPNPLQLLEEPISAKRRAQVALRALDAQQEPGYWVQAKKQNEDRTTEWRSIIGERRRITQTLENNDYLIYKFELHDLPPVIAR